jgi:hypothetical protein
VFGMPDADVRVMASRAKIDSILNETITDPIGPEFMAPLQRS